MTRLIIIRHGRPGTDIRTDGSSADPSLSEIGREQARLTGEFLSGEPVDRIVASPMARAAETAQIIGDVLGISEIAYLDGLKEVDHKRPRYVPAEEMTVDDPLIAEIRRNPMALFDEHGGFGAFQEIVAAAMDHIVDNHRDQRVAVVCHGGVMGAYMCHLLGLTNPFEMHGAYCSIMRVRVHSNGRRQVLSVNESGHVRHTLEEIRLGPPPGR